MSKITKKEVGSILHKTGATFRVWAPFAHSVAVTGSFNNWSHTPMDFEGDGHWSVTIKGVQAGQEYKYVISDGQKLLFKNDPRSLQLTTNDGNSIVVDPHFDWEGDDYKPPTFNEQVIYELHVGTFNRADASTSGTFQDVTDKLDHLADLGINTIELMPIGSMSMDRGWGYAADYIYAVESLYGGRRDFLDFVKAAHKRGIGVVLDVVYNHFGPDKNLDLWQFDGWSQDGKGGIYFYNDWRSSTPWGETRPDYGRAEVRQYILDNVRMWMADSHLDGLRLDSTIYIRNVRGFNNDPPDDIPSAWQLMQDINTISREIKPSALIIAEDSSGNEYITKSSSEGGAGFGAQWEITFPRALRNALDVVDDANRNLTGICTQLTNRYNGDAFRRVIYSDSHDSAANGGARLDEEISPGNPSSVFARRRSLLASAIVLTSPGIPMLFQGQEFMQGGSFNDWQALEWDKAEQFPGIVLAHKHLINLRKNIHKNARGLIGQNLNVVHLNEESKILAYHRWYDGGPNDDVIVVINFTNSSQENYYVNVPRNGLWRVRFNSSWEGYSQDFKGIAPTDSDAQDFRLSVALAPYSVVILSQDN
jgi:1,4-alpha-glucan branching enzyme